jgi:hypothetical protein
MLFSTVLCYNSVEVELADWDPEEDFDLGIFDDHSLDMEEDGGARVDG